VANRHFYRDVRADFPQGLDCGKMPLVGQSIVNDAGLAYRSRRSFVRPTW
jgi:hypothetical protein